MRQWKCILVLVWVLIQPACLFAQPTASKRPPQGEDQYWIGAILLPNASCPRLTFVAMFHRDPGVSLWTGTLSIPRGCGVDGAVDTPLKEIEITDKVVKFVSSGPPSESAFELRLPAPDAMEATGEAMLGRMQSVMIRGRKATREEAMAAAPRRPQNPLAPLPYGAQEVTVPVQSSAGDTVNLQGTLTTPPGTGPFPAVVLVTDAEPQNRDHQEGLHRPFLVLADQLTRAGVAVLRCDDRGVGGSGGSETIITLDESSSDIRTCVEFLKKQPSIDPGRVGVLGKGEGAIVASKVAAADPTIAFVILMAPAGMKGEELVAIREQRQLEAVGEDPTYLELHLKRLRTVLSLASTGKDDQALRSALREDIKAFDAAQKGVSIEMTEDQVAMLTSSRMDALTRPRFKSWLTEDPLAPLKKLACPVLALSAQLDMLTPERDNAPKVKQALEASQSKLVVTKTLPRTNHWFQPCATGYEDEYDQVETTISIPTIEAIVGFLSSAKVLPPK